MTGRVRVCVVHSSRLTAVQVSARVMELAAHLVAPVTMRTSSFGARTVWAKQVIMLRDVYVVMYAKKAMFALCHAMISSCRPRHAANACCRAFAGRAQKLAPCRRSSDV